MTNYEPLTTSFTLSHVEWERCPVVALEGWGWDDSTPSCDPDNGDRDNPVVRPPMGFDYLHGCGELVSLIPGVIPEVGWKVIGWGERGTWVCIPPWYVYPTKPTPTVGWKQGVTALAVGFLVVWGAVNLMPRVDTSPPPQSTFGPVK